MRIAAYCRVSTDKTDQLNSLSVQKNFFVEYAEKNGHDLVRLYADEGISGTKIKRRKEFQQMMLDAGRGMFQVLVVKVISRLARNTVDLLQSVRRLKALGIETVFLTADMTSLGDSEFILTVFGALAQEESRNTSKRVKFSKRINAEKGKVPNLVYGYDKTIGDYFNLTINPKEAAVIRQIYSWYLEEGCGAGKIADMLNRQGLKTKRGCDWNQKAVCRILTNPLYTGKVINGKQEVADFLTSARVDREEADWLVVERPEFRIISDERFEQACLLMKSRNDMFHLEKKRHSNKHLFSTLIICKECGWSFRRVTRTYKNTYVRWVCSKHNGQGIHNCPNAVTVDENELMDKLDEYFLSILKDRSHVEQFLRRRLKEACRQDEEQESCRKSIQARLNRLEKQRQKYLELFTDDLITRQELEQKLSSSKEEMAHL
ncbi:MAG: recombinase family protein, partial [Oscillibacter sp.]|nr:recombinase family protein [Oscillibacter sp.]